jgi:hypothetical protein
MRNDEMNLYLISQYDNNNSDTFDACVVCAESEDSARMITPNAGGFESDRFNTWAKKPENVKVKYLGIADKDIEEGIILASFNAG